MRMFPHFNGSNSRLSVQMSALRAGLFRNGAIRGSLTLMIPNPVTGFEHSRGWYAFYGTQHELMRVMNYIQNRIDSVIAEENRVIQRLLREKVKVDSATGTVHETRVEPRRPTTGALLALQRKLTRHVA